MADNQILFETIISGLSNQLQKLKDLEEKLQGFEDTYSKDYKEVNQRIDAINVQIDTTIKEAIKNIEFPKGISEAEIMELIKSNTNEIDEAQLKQELNKLINKDIGKIKSELLQTIKDIEIPKGEKGERGESVSNDQVQNAISLWIEDNKDLLKGSDGKDGRSIQGSKGKDGDDGVGIADIVRSQDDLLITLTDGTEKRIKLPKPQIQHVGGGGVSYQVATSALIVSTDIDITLKPESQNVLVNATSGNVNITLPNPVDCFSGGRSYKLGITKIDDTNNVVNILPHGSETIALDLHQELLQSQEVLNFISDGTNYWLGR